MIQVLESTRMVMDESQFQTAADKWLEALYELLELEDDEAMLDMDWQEGVMHIVVDDETTFVITKHAPSKQLWLSSPLSGGLHFSVIDNGADWILADGRRLSIVLAEELQQLTGRHFSSNILE
jgi:frataxin